jgi:hypothetical protein
MISAAAPARLGETPPLASAPAGAKPAPTSRDKVAPWPLPSGLALVTVNITPTKAAPRVNASSRDVEGLLAGV